MMMMTTTTTVARPRRITRLFTIPSRRQTLSWPTNERACYGRPWLCNNNPTMLAILIRIPGDVHSRTPQPRKLEEDSSTISTGRPRSIPCGINLLPPRRPITTPQTSVCCNIEPVNCARGGISCVPWQGHCTLPWRITTIKSGAAAITLLKTRRRPRQVNPLGPYYGCDHPKRRYGCLGRSSQPPSNPMWGNMCGGVCHPHSCAAP